MGQKEGNKVTYTLRDPMILELLKVAKQIFNNHLIDTISMFDRIKDEE